MITAKEAQLRSAKIVEENLKNQFYEISKRIAKACENGQDSVCIRNAKNLFLNRFCFDDVRFVLKYKYNYECYLSSEGTTFSVYWCVNTAK